MYLYEYYINVQENEKKETRDEGEGGNKLVFVCERKFVDFHTQMEVRILVIVLMYEGVLVLVQKRARCVVRIRLHQATP
jgi:hypothetical protein